ncbi:hypothetical protein HDU97_001343 [Phlyctochytrium planicorne]|nr:hypothetical protein HDU97_001343 [Phlyctochytrium planicorne]
MTMQNAYEIYEFFNSLLSRLGHCNPITEENAKRPEKFFSSPINVNGPRINSPPQIPIRKASMVQHTRKLSNGAITQSHQLHSQIQILSTLRKASKNNILHSAISANETLPVIMHQVTTIAIAKPHLMFEVNAHGLTPMACSYVMGNESIATHLALRERSYLLLEKEKDERPLEEIQLPPTLNRQGQEMPSADGTERAGCFGGKSLRFGRMQISKPSKPQSSFANSIVQLSQRPQQLGALMQLPECVLRRIAIYLVYPSTVYFFRTCSTMHFFSITIQFRKEYVLHNLYDAFRASILALYHPEPIKPFPLSLLTSGSGFLQVHDGIKALFVDATERVQQMAIVIQWGTLLVKFHRTNMADAPKCFDPPDWRVWNALMIRAISVDSVSYVKNLLEHGSDSTYQNSSEWCGKMELGDVPNRHRFKAMLEVLSRARMIEVAKRLGSKHVLEFLVAGKPDHDASSMRPLKR